MTANEGKLHERALPKGEALEPVRQHPASDWLAVEALTRVKELERLLERQSAPASPWWATLLSAISWPLVVTIVLCALYGNVTGLLTQAEVLLGRANRFKAGDIEVFVERNARERGVPELATSLGRLGRSAIALLIGGMSAKSYQIVGNVFDGDRSDAQQMSLPTSTQLTAIHELVESNLLSISEQAPGDKQRDIPFDVFASRIEAGRGLGKVVHTDDESETIQLTNPAPNDMPELAIKFTEKGEKALEVLRESVADSIASRVSDGAAR